MDSNAYDRTPSGAESIGTMDPVMEESIGDEESGDFSNSNGFQDGGPSEDKPEEIAKRETRMVNYSKTLVVAVIVLVATLIGIITFLFIRGQEESDYTKQVSS